MTLYADGKAFTKGIIQCPACERLDNYEVPEETPDETPYIPISFTQVQRYNDEHGASNHLVVGLRCEEGHQWVLEFQDHWAAVFFNERELQQDSNTSRAVGPEDQ
ncbi:MAG: hypothetical protein IVW55_03995 [Chloroflexi bacterium]|nr:hypothetical protein [Chloroflexota bacterium]